MRWLVAYCAVNMTMCFFTGRILVLDEGGLDLWHSGFKAMISVLLLYVRVKYPVNIRVMIFITDFTNTKANSRHLIVLFRPE